MRASKQDERHPQPTPRRCSLFLPVHMLLCFIRTAASAAPFQHPSSSHHIHVHVADCMRGNGICSEMCSHEEAAHERRTRHVLVSRDAT